MRRSRAIQSGQAVDVAIVCKKKKNTGIRRP